MSRRLTTSLLGGFALLAMFLACAGIYGVLSFVTARRTQEMGIRAAMGASRGDLIRLVIGGGSTPVLAGIVVGLAGAVGLSRFIESMSFWTRPVPRADPGRGQRSVLDGRAGRMSGACMACGKRGPHVGAAAGVESNPALVFLRVFAS